MSPLGREVEAYDYRDLEGHLVYQVVRFEPKTFRQRRPDGSGGWIYKMDGVERIPYRLNDLKTTADLGQCAIVEGERDADKLWAIGFPATTNAGGAGKWTDGHTMALAAVGIKRVALICDNDEPGLAHMQDVARSALTHGMDEVKMIHFHDLPVGGDVGDWLDQGGTREDLAVMILEAPPMTPQELAPQKPQSDDGAMVVRLNTIHRERVTWIWKGRIPRGKITMIAGDPGQGKSALLTDIIARVSRGALWPDGTEALQGPVVVLTAEDGLADTVRPRIEAAGGDLSLIHVITAVRRKKRRTDDNTHDPLLELTQDIERLDAVVYETGAVLVVIDPLSAYLGAKTESWLDTTIRSILAPLAAMAERRRVTIICIMHLSKDQQKQAMYRAQGSLAFVAAARAAFAVTEDPDDKNRRLFLPLKLNVARKPPGLAFRLWEDENEVLRVAWEDGTVDVDIEQALRGPASPEDRAEQQDAIGFLQQVLKDGALKATEVTAQAKLARVPERTLYRAKAALKIKSQREGFGPKGEWFWRL